MKRSLQWWIAIAALQLCGLDVALAQELPAIQSGDIAAAEEYLGLTPSPYRRNLHEQKVLPDGSKGYFKRTTVTRVLDEDPAFKTRSDSFFHRLICSADEIVVAKAGNSRSTLTTSKQSIITHTRFDVLTSVKSAELPPGTQFIAVREGGTIVDAGEKLTVDIANSAPFNAGSSYLLFLRKKKRGNLTSAYFADERTIEVRAGKIVIAGGDEGWPAHGELLEDVVQRIQRLSAVKCFGD